VTQQTQTGAAYPAAPAIVGAVCFLTAAADRQ